MEKLTKLVESNKKALLPDRFTAIFDDWTTDDSHCVGVYAASPSLSIDGYSTLLLAFSPLDNETFQDAQNHYEFLKFVLDLFAQSLEHVVA